MVKLKAALPLAGKVTLPGEKVAPISKILAQSPLPSYSVTSPGALESHTVAGPSW